MAHDESEGRSSLKKEREQTDRAKKVQWRPFSAQNQTGFATGWVPSAGGGAAGRCGDRRLCTILFLLLDLF